MTCPRCNGFMVDATIVDPDDLQSETITVWRCVSCGNVVDSVILANRQRCADTRSTVTSPAALRATLKAAA